MTPELRPNPIPALDRLRRRPVSRRSLLKGALTAGGVAASGGVLTSLLAACGGGSDTPAAASTAVPGQAGTPTTGGAAETSTAGAGEPQRGGTLTWAYTSPVMKLDPVWTQALVDGTVLNQICEALARATRDGTGVEPALAETWDVSEDGLTYTYHLRQGVKFHNGKDLTSADVVASLQRNKAMGSYMWQLQEAESIEAVDDATVRITLSNKVASFPARLAVLSNAIFPSEEIEQIGDQEFTNPIGTGPFKLREWVRNDHLTLDKNPDYWDMAPDGQPMPYLDQVVVRLVPEVTTQVLQVQAGQINGGSVPYSQVESLKNDSQGQLVTFPQQQIYFMVLQVTRPPFDDVKVRQAMSLALDRQVMVQQVTAGTATVANSFFPAGTFGWDPDLELPTDLDRAKQLMAESKYPDGHEGALLQFPSGSKVGNDNAVLAQQMWQQIGLNFTIQEVESSTLGANWYDSNFEAISGYQWTNGMADPEQLVQFFFVTPRMNTGWEPEQAWVDVVEQASQEMDPAAREDLLQQTQEIYNREIGGTISLYYTHWVGYLSTNVQNYYHSPLGNPYWKETWLATS